MIHLLTYQWLKYHVKDYFRFLFKILEYSGAEPKRLEFIMKMEYIIFVCGISMIC